jgi:hypothetical protein
MGSAVTQMIARRFGSLLGSCRFVNNLALLSKRTGAIQMRGPCETAVQD